MKNSFIISSLIDEIYYNFYKNKQNNLSIMKIVLYLPL
jgi:hypothetical protein